MKIFIFLLISQKIVYLSNFEDLKKEKNAMYKLHVRIYEIEKRG